MSCLHCAECVAIWNSITAIKINLHKQNICGCNFPLSVKHDCEAQKSERASLFLGTHWLCDTKLGTCPFLGQPLCLPFLFLTMYNIPNWFWWLLFASWRYLGIFTWILLTTILRRAIRDYYERTGNVVGFKPAGGIRTAKDACTWLILIKEELGDEWLNNSLFRIGASGLLVDIERQLFHYVTGRYGAARELAMSWKNISYVMLMDF